MDSDIAQDAYKHFRRMADIITEVDPKKAAFSFYGIVKQAYGYVEDEEMDSFEVERLEKEIAFAKRLIMLCMVGEGWSEEQIEDFEAQLKELRQVKTGD